MKKQQFITFISALLIILWVYAAGSKLWFYAAFKTQLARQPLPGWSIPVLSWLLPLVELIAVALLSFQKTLRIGLLLSFLLLLAFAVYVGLGLAHVFNKVPCNCGGILGKMEWGSHFIFNICFTIVAFWGWRLTKTSDEFFIKRKLHNA
ncbi:hypothetical protein A9P82_08840 [Arachidicoccus ginsenosidimutans]|uniref:MauE/DoxX family redox-associated membrane protein n=1 Tax=Arachidicoccus sp. BS20 TaxID=1850526 RepID=UPI0007F0800B|nr:MauE/DoxX family redox-associated membrane protein [Arachidicoccus sp. BS20]ANI89389.1 hypothetical protein A9P82_08840 [Arachidicoccus sp. BS20]